jgi:hypothetical protein
MFGQLGVTARCVDAADLDEQRHEEDDTQSDQHSRPPMLLDPLGDVLVEFWVKNGISQPGEGTVGVHIATFVEDVTVAKEIVTRGTRDLVQDLLVALSLTVLGREVAIAVMVDALRQVESSVPFWQHKWHRFVSLVSGMLVSVQ